MDELIVKVLRGEATDFEHRQLDRWRGTSSENELEFRELKRLWARALEVEEASVPPPPTLSEILKEGNRVRKRASVRRKARRAFRSPLLGVGFAAAAVIALVFVGTRTAVGPSPERSALSPVETSIGRGEVTTLGLSDGSVVRLASGSRIQFPPSSQGRTVVVEGKAFFAVASGRDPFSVQTRMGEVRVRGTRFEVEVDRARLRVIVLEGSVEVEGERGSVQIGPGQIAYVPADGVPVAEDGGDISSLLSWPGGLLVFQETPFSDAAREVADHFGVEFSLPTGDLAERRITAWFGDESLGEAVSGLCMVAGAECDLDAGRVTVR
jgi:transmembrane sensor